MKNFFKKIFTLCPLCSYSSGGEIICSTCREQLMDELVNSSFMQNGFKIHVITFYQGISKELLKEFKFNCNKKIDKVFSSLLISYSEKNGLKDSLFIPIPSSLKGEKERGFNQVKLILDKSGLNWEDVLSLNPNHAQQTQKTLNKSERIVAAMDKFIIDKKAIQSVFKGSTRRVIVIDDVWTTGSTILSALTLLKSTLNDLSINNVSVEGLVIEKTESAMAF